MSEGEKSILFDIIEDHTGTLSTIIVGRRVREISFHPDLDRRQSRPIAPPTGGIRDEHTEQACALSHIGLSFHIHPEPRKTLSLTDYFSDLLERGRDADIRCIYEPVRWVQRKPTF